ncbi:MAG: hypothetical protein K2J08_12945 [Ruminococcus sp.]|nr:hypothetical protein [Ruminococcus sp.]
MNELKKALALADENFLVGLSNKGTYKRAMKDTDGAVADFETGDNSATVRTGGETCTITLPLAESKCTCISRGICRHIIGAIIILKNNTDIDISEDKKEPETVAEPLIIEEPKQEAKVKKKEKSEDKDTEKIKSCALSCLEVLGDIMRYGLVRIPENLPDMLESMAVRCHTLKMAEAERSLRSLGRKLSDCMERRASFNMEYFTADLCRCSDMLKRLGEGDTDPEIIGSFRQTYTDYKGTLDIMPVGMRSIKGGEYEGNIYYFLNMDNSADIRFMSLSDLRPTFYNDTNKRFYGGNGVIWGSIVNMREMMHSEMKLINAKVSGGKLSTSKETQIVSTGKAVLDCDEVRELVYTDFRKLATDISEKNPDGELDKLCFVQAEKCTESGFDKYSQQQIIMLEDKAGNRISVRAKYRAETKDFINLLGNIGTKMTKHPEKNYIFLASAYIENGELTLFPIEIYDFIRPPEHEEYELPEKYGDTEISAEYAESIQEFFGEVKDKVCNIIRSGLQADIKNDHRLENLAFNYGLKGFSEIIGDFMACASAYRHSTEADCTEVLEKMNRIITYINHGRKRLEIITSLNNMKGSN